MAFVDDDVAWVTTRDRPPQAVAVQQHRDVGGVANQSSGRNGVSDASHVADAFRLPRDVHMACDLSHDRFSVRAALLCTTSGIQLQTLRFPRIAMWMC